MVRGYTDVVGSNDRHSFSSTPGLYIQESRQDIPKELRGIGIRIEDDILITESGPHNLTSACPKYPVEIENLMKRGKEPETV